jgi:hypothetical protein
MNDLFKAYALCLSTGKIKLTPDTTFDKYKCQVFKTLEEANKERISKNPYDYKILEIYGNNLNSHSKFKMELTYTISHTIHK